MSKKAFFLPFLALILMPGCKYQPKLKVGDCIYSRSDTNVKLNEYYKIVGMSEDRYTVKYCHETSLRGENINGQEYAPMSLEACFSDNIMAMQFQTFDENKTADGVSHSGLPILCSEIH